MTLEWIGDAVLLFVVLPVVVYLLHGVWRAARPPGVLGILNKVAQHYQLPVERLREKGGYGLEARNVAMWLVWEKSGMSLREIGEVFGGRNFAAVAQRIRRLSDKEKLQAAKLL